MLNFRSIIQLNDIKNDEKYILFILFTSFIAAQACGQSKTFDKLAYTASIEKAENFILKNDYEKAIKNYNDSFKLNATMFSVDLYNALLRNVYLKKWYACEDWSMRLINKGVTIHFFNANKFAEFKRTKQWSNVLKKFSKHKSKVDFEYVKVLDSLVIEDQNVYCGIPTRVLNYEEAKENTLTVEEKFAFLLNKYRYPTEEKVGISVYNDTTKFMKEDLAREKRLKFINANRQNGFLIFAKFSQVGNFVDESSVEVFHQNVGCIYSHLE